MPRAIFSLALNPLPLYGCGNGPHCRAACSERKRVCQIHASFGGKAVRRNLPVWLHGYGHEIAAGGGYYASDLLSGTYIVGGSYTYHMTDQTAVEFAGWWTHANADIIRALEADRGTVISDTYAREIFAESLLVWSPVYGKLRLGGSIVHFDLHAELGVGVIDSNTSRGAAGVFGFGIKLFMGQATAFRIDARNRTFRQELLDERFLVNDSAVTASLSVFLPFHN